MSDHRAHLSKWSHLSLPRAHYRRLWRTSLALSASSLHHWLHMLRLAFARTAGSLEFTPLASYAATCFRSHCRQLEAASRRMLPLRKSINMESTLWSPAFRFRSSRSWSSSSAAGILLYESRAPGRVVSTSSMLLYGILAISAAFYMVSGSSIAILTALLPTHS